MTKHHTSESGFTLLEFILILVIVGILGFSGWYVWHSKQAANKALSSSNSTTPTYKKKVSSKVPTTTQPVAPAGLYSGWNSGSLKREGLMFKYPSSWTLADNSQTAGVCAPNAQNCPDRSMDSVTLTAPSGLVVNISAGNNPVNLTARYQGQGCPAPQDTCTHYADIPVTLNGKSLYMVIWGYKEYNVAENLYLGLSKSPDCILYCADGLGPDQKLPGDTAVNATYPDRNITAYTAFANDASVKDAELVIKSLHY